MKKSILISFFILLAGVNVVIVASEPLFDESVLWRDLSDAVGRNNEEKVGKLLEVVAEKHLEIPPGPLHWASCLGRLNIMRMLINARADVNQPKEPHQITPLADMIYRHHTTTAAAVRLLLNRGADIYFYPRDTLKRSCPLGLVARYKNTGLFETNQLESIGRIFVSHSIKTRRSAEMSQLIQQLLKECYTQRAGEWLQKTHDAIRQDQRARSLGEHFLNMYMWPRGVSALVGRYLGEQEDPVDRAATLKIFASFTE